MSSLPIQTVAWASIPKDNICWKGMRNSGPGSEILIQLLCFFTHKVSKKIKRKEAGNGPI